jgi:hypothetical protein
MESDPIYDSNYEALMKAFCKTIRGQCLLTDITYYIEAFKKSPILNIIIKSPNNTMGINCLNQFLATHPSIPSDFANKLLMLATTKLSVSNLSFPNSESYVVKLDMSKIKPTNRITNQSCVVLQRQLQQDLKDNCQVYTANNNIVPERRYVSYTEEDQNLIVKCLNDLNEVIKEGQRRNGMTGEEIIPIQN